MTTDVHQVITDKIVVALGGNEAGQWTCPWHQTGGGLPTNFVTGKPYHGINTLALWVAAAQNDYARQEWASYRQWASIGAQVRRGETGSLVVFYKELDQDPGEQAANDNTRRFVAKGSFVFNAMTKADEISATSSSMAYDALPNRPLRSRSRRLLCPVAWDSSWKAVE